MKTIMFILLFAAILFMNGIVVKAAIVSNSIIVDDIEYYMQVDDSVYSLGEDVEMLYRITNLK